jgi:hypothetical protein
MTMCFDRLRKKMSRGERLAQNIELSQALRQTDMIGMAMVKVYAVIIREACYRSIQEFRRDVELIPIECSVSEKMALSSIEVIN